MIAFSRPEDRMWEWPEEMDGHKKGGRHFVFMRFVMVSAPFFAIIEQLHHLCHCPVLPDRFSCRGEIVRVEESGHKIGVAATVDSYTFQELPSVGLDGRRRTQ
jgi:hypothetical protein